MVVPAHWVAAELRRQLPQLSTGKLQKLLYLCQGHHLAWFDESLFGEPIAATDRGPVVALSPAAPGQLSRREQNTVDYIAGRYGPNSTQKLAQLAHGPVDRDGLRTAFAPT